MMDIQPSLPEDTKLNPGSRLRFICALLGHVVEATGTHGRADDYDLCARCGLRQTWGDKTDAWKHTSCWGFPRWWHAGTRASGSNPHPRSKRWWDRNA